jgi:hypothetical protein
VLKWFLFMRDCTCVRVFHISNRKKIPMMMRKQEKLHSWKVGHKIRENWAKIFSSALILEEVKSFKIIFYAKFKQKTLEKVNETKFNSSTSVFNLQILICSWKSFESKFTVWIKKKQNGQVYHKILLIVSDLIANKLCAATSGS